MEHVQMNIDSQHRAAERVMLCLLTVLILGGGSGNVAIVVSKRNNSP